MLIQVFQYGVGCLGAVEEVQLVLLDVHLPVRVRLNVVEASVLGPWLWYGVRMLADGCAQWTMKRVPWWPMPVFWSSCVVRPVPQLR
ncbi:hypothetical protein [Streptomyces griseorubiginosus]